MEITGADDGFDKVQGPFDAGDDYYACDVNSDVIRSRLVCVIAIQ